MKKPPSQFRKIESVTIRRNRFGVTGIVYANGYAFAVRFASDYCISETTLRKLWSEAWLTFHPYNDSTDQFL